MVVKKVLFDYSNASCSMIHSNVPVIRNRTVLYIIGFLVCVLMIYAILYVSRQRLSTYHSIHIKLPEYFKYVRCIALPSRRDHAESVLRSVGIPYEIMEPVLKDQLNVDELKAQGFLSENSPLNKGRIACHMSHLKTLKEFLLSSEEHRFCTVFEDDIMTFYSQREIFYITNGLFDDMQRNGIQWDVVYLSKCWENCERTRKIGNHLYTADSPVCRHAYVVTREGARRIIQTTSFMDKLPGDEMMRKMIQDGKLRAYSCVPQLFVQNRQTNGVMKSNLNNHGLLPECSTAHRNVSLIVMNYLRPHVLKRILQKMIMYSVIDEILVINNKMDTKLHFFNSYHTKIRTFDAWDDHDTYGVANRFIYAKYAKNNQIMYIDDDVYVSESYIHQLKKAASKDPNNIYGFFRRICNSKDGYVHDDKVIGDRYDTIITGCMLTSKHITQSFVDHMNIAHEHATNPELTKTKWNGEDLFLNMVLRTIYKKQPVYVQPHNKKDVVFIRDRKGAKSDVNAISNQAGHFEYRDTFCRTFSEKLSDAH